jgi:hypothetical protein
MESSFFFQKKLIFAPIFGNILTMAKNALDFNLTHKIVQPKKWKFI